MPQRLRLTDLAYAAGFFDGEGSITVGIRDNHVRLEVAVSQKYPAVLLWFERNFAGHAYPQFMQWKTSGNHGVTFLLQIMPYLIVKNVDATEAIAIWRARTNLDEARQLIAERSERRGNK